MVKKQAVIWGYFAKNLGDDLMLKAFVNKFENKYKRIYINSYKKYKSYYEEFGITVIATDSILYRGVNKIFTAIGSAELYYKLAKKAHTDFIMLGGSLFAETENRNSMAQINNLEYAVNQAQNSYVIGSNFGPYNSDYFLNNYNRIFKKCDDVCFRDEYSYRLFSNLLNTRYAPDIILSGIWEESRIRSKTDDVVISVINLKNRQGLNSKVSEYENILAGIADYYAERDNRVILASFCEREGDLETCIHIKNLCKYNKNIEIKSYESFEFLKVLSNAKAMYGSRFHSIILSIYYGIPCVPFIYSEKTYNALSAYCERFEMIEIDKISNYSVQNILNMCELIELKPNIKDKAKKQFKRGH